MNDAVMAMLIMVASLGVMGNMLLAWIVLTNKTLRVKSTHLLVVNLAVAQLALDLSIIAVAIGNLSTGHWISSTCDFAGFLMTIFGVQSLLALLLIAIDRYRMLVLIKNVGLTARQQVGCVVVQMFVAILTASAPLLGWGTFIIQPAQIYCIGLTDTTASSLGQMIYTIWCSCILWGAVIVTGFLYWRIHVAVHASAMAIRMHVSPPHLPTKMMGEKKMHRRTKTHTPEVLQHETKVNNRMFLLVIVVFLNWMGYGIGFVYQLTTLSVVPYWFDTLSIFMVILGTISNPIINIVFNQRYQQVLMQSGPWLSSRDSVERLAPSPAVGTPRTPRSHSPRPSQQQPHLEVHHYHHHLFPEHLAPPLPGAVTIVISPAAVADASDRETTSPA